MSMAFRKVRLTRKKKWPQHGADPVPGKHRFAPWRGKEITVSPAIEPLPTWKCGTKEVYLVSDESLRMIGVHKTYFGNVYVCQHQIEEI